MSRISPNRRGVGNSFGIVPQPLSIHGKQGQPFKITGNTDIVYQDENSRPCAEYLQGHIERATGMSLTIKSFGESNAIILKSSVDAVEFDEEEAYYLESNEDAVVIIGKSARGLFCGIQTLLQLLPAGIYSSTPLTNLDLTIDALEIKDRPVMGKIRGLHVDIARHFRTKEELMKIIDCMVMHKLNTLHIHLTDDEGWRVEVKAYPKLTTVGAIGCRSNAKAPAKFLTQDEFREVYAYAKSRYISIIPEIDMPGHMGAAIRSYPGLKSPTEPREAGRVIRIDEKGQEFARNVLREMDSLFEPEYIHIGCDEVNLGSGGQIYADEEIVGFACVMSTFIKDDLEKTPIVWDDAFVHGLHDKDAVVHWWRYGKVHWWASMERTVDEGLNAEKQPFIMSPAYWTYFDMPNVGESGWAKPISTAEMYNWDPFEDMFGATDNTRELALGAIACTWSESIKTMKDFGDCTFPRLAAYSERLWRGGKSDSASILNWKNYRDNVLMGFQLDRYDTLGLWYWGKDDPTKLQGLEDVRKKLE